MEMEADQARMQSVLGSFPRELEPGEAPKYPIRLSKEDMKAVVDRYDIPPRFLDPRRSIRIVDKAIR